MATVHPSRMGLVPQDPKDVYPGLRRGRSPSPSHRYARDRRERDRDSESDNDSEGGRGGERERGRPDDRRDRRRDRGDDRTSPRQRDSGRRMDDRDKDRDRGRYRERERDKDRNGDRDRSRSRRRASPEYGDYKRPASPGLGTPNMYPNRQLRDRTYERRSGYGGGGSEYLERCATFYSLGRVNSCAEMRSIAAGRKGRVPHSVFGHLHQRRLHVHCMWLFHVLSVLRHDLLSP